jgi:uncharacterized protein (DUF2147 family)
MLSAQSGITGVWYNSAKSGKIEIIEQDNEYTGKIIWIDEPLSEETGKPKVDESNPKKENQNNPIIGLPVLKNFVYEGESKYTGGTVYDPENGKTYKCKMTLIDDNNLDVRGYLGFSFIGRTENWTRASK